jgi:RNA polymerase sigma-70 factor, ECF subfamily
MNASATDQEWVCALQSSAIQRDEALSGLRRILLKSLRTALSKYPAVTDSHREDFVQEALIKILNGLNSYRGESRFITWALKITIRIAFSEMRRHRWKDVSLEEMLENSANGSNVNGVRANQEPQMLSNQILKILDAVIRHDLSNMQRQVVIPYFIQGIPLDEIARRMGKTRNHLYKIQYDARNRLKDALMARGITASDVESAFQGD